MQQMSQQTEPPTKDKAFMDKVGWQLILLFATFFAALIAAIILGTTHIIGFDWIVTILVGIMFVIMLYCVWYTFRTRQKLQERYNRDIAELRRDNQTFKTEIRRMREEETRGWHEWAVPFTLQVDKEHRERTEELKRQLMETIHDTEQRLDGSLKSSMSLYKTAQETAGIIIDQYREQLIHEMRRMDAIEEHFKNMTLHDDQE